MSLTLGLDISTSIVGFSIVDENKKILKIGLIDLRKIKNILYKSDTVLDIFKNIKKDYNIYNIVIEEALKKFYSERSSAHVIAKLQAFNSVISYLSYKMFNTEPIMINASTARKQVLGRSRVSNMDTKEYVFCEMYKLLSEQQRKSLPTMKSGKNAGCFSKICYDITDSMVLALYGHCL